MSDNDRHLSKRERRWIYGLNDVEEFNRLPRRFFLLVAVIAGVLIALGWVFR